MQIMKVGQGCTYRDSDGRSFSALIERVIQQKDDDKKSHQIVNVVFKQSGKDRRAELVPKSQISNVHDISEDIISKIEDTEEEESNSIETHSTDDNDYEDN